MRTRRKGAGDWGPISISVVGLPAPAPNLDAQERPGQA